ncbi:MAG TPA: stalk domain-containing protein [Caldisericia bacterium]|nr:stalk domain-containing protein [Caldisericia bacterium]
MKKIILFLILIILILNAYGFSYQNIEIIGKGGGFSNLIFPTGIYSASNKLYISNYYGNTISICDLNNNTWSEFGCYGEEAGKFINPNSITISQDKKIFVTDTGNSRIQVFDDKSNYLFSFGKDRLTSPIDAYIYGNKIYVTDFEISKIIVFDLNGKYITEFGKRGTNVSEFDGPLGICLDNNGNIFVCDSKNKRVQIFDNNFVYKKTIQMDGAPCDIFVANDKKIYISDYNNFKIYIYSEMGANKIKEQKINTDTDWYFYKAPISIYVSQDNYLFYSVPWENRVEILKSDGNLYKSLGEKAKEGKFLYPKSISISNNKIFVVDYMANSINIYDLEEKFNSNINYSFEHPTSITNDESGNIYIVSRYLGEIISLDKNLNFKYKIKEFNGDSFSFPQDIFSFRNKLYVADSYNDRIVIFSTEGNFIKTFGKSGSGIYEFNYPNSIYVDKDENLFVLDNGNKRVMVYDKNLNFKYEGKNLNLSNPTSLYIYGQYIFISDESINDIKIYSWDGNKITFIKSFGGIGGPLTKNISLRSQELNYNFEPGMLLEPQDVFAFNNFLYVVDSGNRRVQKIALSDVLEEVTEKEEIVITLWVDKPNALINNKEIYIDPDNIKVVPFIIPPGRTVVPIRFISETFGAKVDWEGDTKTVRIYLESKNIRITLQVDNKIARLNDKVVTLDAAPLIKEGRTFVPLRFISEAFGAKVDWFSSEKKIVIEYNP